MRLIFETFDSDSRNHDTKAIRNFCHCFFNMKTFKLYLGGKGLLGTFEVTAKPDYEIVIETVGQIRSRLLADPHLRQPILHIFNTVY
jgi:hypothetical protein